MPSSAGEDGTDSLGAVPSVLQILRTDGTVDNIVTNLILLATTATKKATSKIIAGIRRPIRTHPAIIRSGEPRVGALRVNNLSSRRLTIS